jgi:hypothetical protein
MKPLWSALLTGVFGGVGLRAVNRLGEVLEVVASAFAARRGPSTRLEKDVSGEGREKLMVFGRKLYNS